MYNNSYNNLAWLIGEPKIGPNTWIGPFTLIDGSGGLTIGDGCDISAGVQIYTHETVRRCVSGRQYNHVDRQSTTIGNNVFIGANSVILMGSIIESNSIIAAGSVVKGLVPSNSIFAGSIARKIGKVSVDKNGTVNFSYSKRYFF